MDEWRVARGLERLSSAEGRSSAEDEVVHQALGARILESGEQAARERRSEHAVAVALSEFAGKIGRAWVQAWSDRMASQWWLLVDQSKVSGLGSLSERSAEQGFVLETSRDLYMPVRTALVGEVEEVEMRTRSLVGGGGGGGGRCRGKTGRGGRETEAVGDPHD